MNNIYHPAVNGRRISETPPRRAQTEGADLQNDTASYHSAVTRRLHKHRQTVSNGSTDPYKSRRYHMHTRSHGHHHIADGLRTTMPEQVQHLAAENERHERQRQARPGLQRELTAEKLARPEGYEERQQQQSKPEPRITEDDIAKERCKQKARDEELLDTLHHLSEHSLTTTRRLDDTYYSILERVSHLRSTINSLQELSTLTKTLCTDFEAESQSISKDVKKQTDHFDDFSEQCQRINELERRIKQGQLRAEKLGDRLGRCRERVTWVEKRDAEELKRSTRWWRGLWSTLSVIGVILLLALVVHHLRAPNRHVRRQETALGRVEHALNRSKGVLPVEVEVMMEELRRDREKAGEQVQLDRRKDDKAAKRLNVFDEL